MEGEIRSSGKKQKLNAGFKKSKAAGLQLSGPRYGFGLVLVEKENELGSCLEGFT